MGRGMLRVQSSEFRVQIYFRFFISAVSLIVLGAGALVARGFQASELPESGTFSILGYDPATGEIGAAVQSRVFSVGNGVLWADANAGVAMSRW